MDTSMAVTILGMMLNAMTTTSAAVIVYMTYLAKLKYDTEMLAMKHRISCLESQVGTNKPPTE